MYGLGPDGDDVRDRSAWVSISTSRCCAGCLEVQPLNEAVKQPLAVLRRGDRLAVLRCRVKDRVFRDPVHGLIEFKGDDRPIADLLDTHAMQRLRRIKQMGFAWLVYPAPSTRASATRSARSTSRSA